MSNNKKLSPESIKLYAKLLAKCDRIINAGPFSHLSVEDQIKKMEEFSKYLKEKGEEDDI